MRQELRGEMLSTPSRPKGNNSEQLLLRRLSKASTRLQAQPISACQPRDMAESTQHPCQQFLCPQSFPVRPILPSTRAGGLTSVLAPSSHTEVPKGEGTRAAPQPLTHTLLVPLPPAPRRVGPTGTSKLPQQFPAKWWEQGSEGREHEGRGQEQKRCCDFVPDAGSQRGRLVSILDVLHKNKRCWLTAHVLIFRKQAPIYFFYYSQMVKKKKKLKFPFNVTSMKRSPDLVSTSPDQSRAQECHC